jgi:transcription elongation GreA/GreB family factor
MMRMMNFNLEDLFFEATEKEDEELIHRLYSSLAGMPKLSGDEVSSGLEFLLEAWGDAIESSPVKAKFCLDLSILSPPDSPALRISLHRAFNCLKTSAFMKSAVVKATGVRNESLSVKAIGERFIVLENIKPGIGIFNPETNRIGKVEQLDEITSEVTVKWDTANSATVMDLATALDGILYFENMPKLTLSSGKKISVPVSEWKEKVKKAFISEPEEVICKQISFTMSIEAGITPEAFEKWWNSTSAKSTKKSKERHPSTARTLHELNTLLLNYKGGKFSKEQQSDLHKSLGSMILRQEPPEMLMLAESLAMLADYIPEENLVNIACEIKDKVMFWPQSLASYIDKLHAWEKLSAKHLPAVAQLTADIFSQDYLAALMLVLSFRCWNSMAPVLDKQVLSNTIENAPFLSADALMWIWKNRSKLPAQTVAVLSPAAMRTALDTPGLTAIPELKELFISDKTFQKEMLNRIEGKEMDLLRAVQACENLRMDEKQSLLVKFSALSPAVKDFIEKGDGKKMFAAAGRKHVEQQSADAFEITSIESFADMTGQLNDIINKQIPENSAAIAHARSYGDLRENAEYKAAKERQAFLNMRRAEIDSSIQRTQPVDFSLEKPGKTAIPGSTVTLKYKDDESEEIFYLLGVWDSDPDTNCVAYSSGLGKVINGKISEDELKLPDGRDAVLLKIDPLPEDMVEKLNSE